MTSMVLNVKNNQVEKIEAKVRIDESNIRKAAGCSYWLNLIEEAFGEDLVYSWLEDTHEEWLQSED